MGGLFSVLGLRSRPLSLIPLLLVLTLFTSSDVFSEEPNQNEPGTSQEPDRYEKMRAPK